MRLLSPWFIREWKGRILNIHPSLLPDYKGLDTHKRAILDGQIYAGCSVHMVTEELDGGPVIAQAKVRIRERETPEMLAERVLKEEHKLYPEALDIFCRTLREQNSTPSLRA
jgi:phosphoribosylglycinamide formyltransferase-1